MFTHTEFQVVLYITNNSIKHPVVCLATVKRFQLLLFALRILSNINHRMEIQTGFELVSPIPLAMEGNPYGAVNNVTGLQDL